MIDDIIDLLDIASDANSLADSASDISDVIATTMNSSDLTDFAEIDDLSDVSQLTDLCGNVISNSSDLTDLSCADNFADGLELDSASPINGYNVSFGSQQATLHTPGNGLHLDATITKEPGTSNQFCIKTNKGTIHNVSGGTQRVWINGIQYMLPKLIG